MCTHKEQNSFPKRENVKLPCRRLQEFTKEREVF